MSDWSIPTEPPQPAHAAPNDDDVLDELVAACVESGSAELAGRVESACVEHPRLASALRRRIESLREVGLLRDETLVVDDRFPERLGDFRLLERLGGGGMGVVFRASQRSLDRDVALKLIRPDQLYFPRARERFQRETEAVARLQHPGIVPIYAVGDEGGVPYFAMELIGGCTLATALAALQRSAPERLTASDLQAAVQRASSPSTGQESAPTVALFQGSYVAAITRLIIQVAEALEHAHARDVLHRDVKPSNVAVTPDGRALLFDFGLASFSNVASRLTASNAEVGSVHYMAPEQVRGDTSRVGPRADVYSLGVTLYESLALQLPYAERDLLATRKAILEGRRDPLRARNRAVSRDLEIVCAKAMELDPARRYASAGEFASDLRNVLEHRPIRARSPSALLVASRWVRRHPTTSTALAAGGLVAIGLPTALAVQSSLHAKSLSDALADAQHQRSLAVDAQKDATQQRDIARDEATQAGEINRFLLGMFVSVDPAQAQGRTVTARELLDQGAERLRTQMLDQPLVRASLLNSIGASYTSLSEWERAESVLNDALELREKNAGPESLEVAESLSSLAELERELGRPGALEHSTEAVELFRRHSPQPTFDFADALVGYGQVLDAMRRFEEAEGAYREALEMFGKLPGDQGPARAMVLTNVAYLEHRMGRPENAIVAAREALELQRAVNPHPHPAATSCLNVLGLALTTLGRYDEARPIFDELLDEERQLTGEESERYATFLASKSHVELRTGHFAETVALLERAMALFDKVATPENENSMTCRYSLANAYMRAARWRDALATFRVHTSLLETTWGPTYFGVLLNHVECALCYEALSDWDAAEHELTDALERAADASQAEDDSWEALGHALLARFIARRGDLARAAELVAQARALRPDSELRVAAQCWTRLAAGVVAQAAGDAERAQHELEELAALNEGPRWAEWAPSAARAHLAAVITDPARARELSERAYAELLAALGPTHPEVVSAAHVRASLQEH